MAVINYYTILNDLQSQQWQLLSQEYKNLKTPLDMICPKGHSVSLTYENWRKNHSCPECQRLEGEKDIRNKFPKKPLEVKRRVLALDAATGITGYSIFDDGKLVAYGTYVSGKMDTEQRIHAIKKWLEAVCDSTCPDFVGLENIQLQKDVQIFQTLANLQGVIKDTLHERNIQHDLVYSSTWRSNLGINKNAQRNTAKKITQDFIKMCYKIDATQDEADAICIGKYFSSFLSPSWGESIR